LGGADEDGKNSEMLEHTTRCSRSWDDGSKECVQNFLEETFWEIGR
jgi:hypothetical protein